MHRCHRIRQCGVSGHLEVRLFVTWHFSMLESILALHQFAAETLTFNSG